MSESGESAVRRLWRELFLTMDEADPTPALSALASSGALEVLFEKRNAGLDSRLELAKHACLAAKDRAMAESGMQVVGSR